MATILVALAWLTLFFAVSSASPPELKVLRRQNSSSIPLRIMSIGASVTLGVGSTTGNSYRKDLRDLLVGAGHTVNFVGGKKNGQFTDNDVEATGGFVISQIAKSAAQAVPAFQPNLILLDAGTNNCNKGGMVPDAGTNVTKIVQNVYRSSPGSTVLLAGLLVNKNASQDACRVDVNKQFDTLAIQFQAGGAKFVLLNMRGSDGPTKADLNDTRHPNDVGYVKMANVWFGGINQAIARNLIIAPAVNVSLPDDGGA